MQVHYVKDVTAAYTHVAAELSAFRAASKGPTVAVVEAHGGAAALRPHVAPLRDLPCCDMAPADCGDKFASQTWQLDLAHEALLGAMQWHACLDERARVARCALTAGLF